MGNTAPAMKRAKCANCLAEVAAERAKHGDGDIWRDATGTYDATYFAEVEGGRDPDPLLSIRQHWTVTSKNNTGGWTHQYKACDNCIAKDMKPAFEYRPDGYDEPGMK